MKSSLIVVAFFCIGCLVGIFNDFQFDMHNLSMYILYALMLQVGISIGSNKNLKFLIKSLRPNMLLVPIATIVGTLLFSAFASLLLSQWSVFDCMAVGSGFAYYSLSSILITQFKEASVGLQLATELGTIALLANIFREMMALLGTPLIRKYFGKLIGGNPNIDFEHNHDFTIEISFDNYIPVIIKINGWEIVNEEI